MEYNIGQMPNTEFRYEEFEGLLGSFHLSLLPLRNSKKAKDRDDYATAMNVLNGFAKRYKVQKPEDVVIAPRTEYIWAKPRPFNSNETILEMTDSFWKDFGVGMDIDSEDGLARYALGRTILRVFDRYSVANVEYINESTPIKLKNWNVVNSRKTLDDLIY